MRVKKVETGRVTFARCGLVATLVSLAALALTFAKGNAAITLFGKWNNEQIVIAIAGIGRSVVTYNVGYNAALSEISADQVDASYESLIEKVTREEIKLTDPVPKMFLENWAEGYYD